MRILIVKILLGGVPLSVPSKALKTTEIAQLDLEYGLIFEVILNSVVIVQAPRLK